MTKVENITVDTTEAMAQLDALKEQSSITARAVMNSTRKAYRTVMLFMDISRMAIPQTLALTAEAFFVGGEVGGY
jgi:hypothetical protein